MSYPAQAEGLGKYGLDNEDVSPDTNRYAMTMCIRTNRERVHQYTCITVPIYVHLEAGELMVRYNLWLETILQQFGINLKSFHDMSMK